MVYFQNSVEGASLWSYQKIAFEHSISGIVSYGICRSQKRVVAIILNTKFDFISLIAYSIVDLICFRVVKMQKVSLMIILMINGPYGLYLLIGRDPSQCLVVLSDAIKNIAIYKS